MSTSQILCFTPRMSEVHAHVQSSVLLSHEWFLAAIMFFEMVGETQQSFQQRKDHLHELYMDHLRVSLRARRYS